MPEELKLITVEKKPDPPKPEKKTASKVPAEKRCSSCSGSGVYVAPNGWEGECYKCDGTGFVKAKPKKRRKRARFGVPTTLVLALLGAAILFGMFHFHILDTLRSLYGAYLGLA